MRVRDVALMWDHLYWCRDRVLGAADNTSINVDAPTAAGRTLRGTLVHELDVEWSWRVRLSGTDRTRFGPDDQELVPDDFPTIDTIRARWRDDEREMRAWLAALDDRALAGPCRAETSRSHPFWFHLQHLYSHGIQQLADAAAALTAADRSPGELDFLEFVEARERDGQSFAPRAD